METKDEMTTLSTQTSYHCGQMFMQQTVSPLKIALLGWPTIVLILGHFIWFIMKLCELISKPYETHTSLISDSWQVVLLPAMLVPTTFVWAYCNWCSWKFFERN